MVVNWKKLVGKPATPQTGLYRQAMAGENSLGAASASVRCAPIEGYKDLFLRNTS